MKNSADTEYHSKPLDAYEDYIARKRSGEELTQRMETAVYPWTIREVEVPKKAWYEFLVMNSDNALLNLLGACLLPVTAWLGLTLFLFHGLWADFVKPGPKPYIGGWDLGTDAPAVETEPEPPRLQFSEYTYAQQVNRARAGLY